MSYCEISTDNSLPASTDNSLRCLHEHGDYLPDHSQTAAITGMRSATTMLWCSKVVPGLQRVLTTCEYGCGMVYDNEGNFSSSKIISFDPFALENFDFHADDDYKVFLEDMSDNIQQIERSSTQQRSHSQAESVASCESDTIIDMAKIIHTNEEPQCVPKYLKPIPNKATQMLKVACSEVESGYSSSEHEYECNNRSLQAPDKNERNILEELEQILHYQQLYAISGRSDRKRQICVTFMVKWTNELIELAITAEIWQSIVAPSKECKED